MEENLKKCKYPPCEVAISSTPGRRPKEYCSSNCRVRHHLAKKRGHILNNADMVVVKKREDGESSEVNAVWEVNIPPVKSDPITPATPNPVEPENQAIENVPKNLDELKALCPYSFGSLERSAWIAEYRQIYNI